MILHPRLPGALALAVFSSAPHAAPAQGLAQIAPPGVLMLRLTR